MTWDRIIVSTLFLGLNQNVPQLILNWGTFSFHLFFFSRPLAILLNFQNLPSLFLNWGSLFFFCPFAFVVFHLLRLFFLFSTQTCPQCGVCDSQGLPNEIFYSEGSKGVTRDRMLDWKRRGPDLYSVPYISSERKLSLMRNFFCMHLN